MNGYVQIALISLAVSVAVGLPTWAVLQWARRLSVAASVGVVVAGAVVSVVIGVYTVGAMMFLSPHDLWVTLVVVASAGVVSLGMAAWLGRGLRVDAMWADEVRDRERRMEGSRRELVAWVSHDLRTPLAGIRAMSEALADGVVSDAETVHAYHDRLRQEADRMAYLVDDLFELSRINAGALELTMERVNLAEVLSDALASASPLAAARGVQLRADPLELPPVNGSEAELGRVVRNLLINAIRFTRSDGTVRLDAGVDTDRTWFAVSDSCGGIPAADLPRVFDVAFRGETARSKETETGAASGGLGLAIARGLVEAHSGSIGIINDGPGCRVTVSLPRA